MLTLLPYDLKIWPRIKISIITYTQEFSDTFEYWTISTLLLLLDQNVNSFSAWLGYVHLSDSRMVT